VGRGERASELSPEELNVLLAETGWELALEDLAGVLETARFLRRAAALVADCEKDGQGPDP
jgi:hypothetical protein